MFILFIVFCIIFWYSLKKNQGIIKSIIFGIIGSYLSLFILFSLLSNLSSIFTLLLILFLVLKGIDYFNLLTIRKKWRDLSNNTLGLFDFQNNLYSTIDIENVRFVDDIPYNRAEFFSMGIEGRKISDNNYPLLFDAYIDKEEMLFQEYGFLATTSELILKIKQKNKNEKEYQVQDYIIPYDGIYKVINKKDKLIVYYVYNPRLIINTTGLTENQKSVIKSLLDYIINSGWSRCVNESIDAVDDTVLEETSEIISEKFDTFQKSEAKLRENISLNNQQDFSTRSVELNMNSSLKSELSNNQINDRFGGGQGHGHVGEQYGNVKDTLLGKHAVPKGNDHSKNGADRIVNGQLVQTKYCATAGKSISQCFDKGTAKYVQNGKMMKIEVPRDQYAKSLELMAKKIEAGQVPNESNPNNAKLYVKKGAISYEHAQIATKSIFDRKSEIPLRDKKNNVVRDKSGNVVMKKVTFGEKLIWSAGGDFLTGVRVALPTAVISGVWIFCNNVWKGQDSEEALKNSLLGMAKPCLTAGSVYCVSSQFAGSKLGQQTGKMLFGNSYTKKEITNKVTGGMALGLTMAMVVGPDVIDCLRGRMSMNQLIKNTVVSGVGMAGGAAMGGAVGSVVPVVGTAIGAVTGGIIGSVAAKKILDNFVEDDAVLMIAIAKEEFISVVIMSPLLQDEFQEVLNKTFLDKKFPKLLKTMFAQDNPREYIHSIYNEYVIEMFTNRELPEEKTIEQFVTNDKLLYS